MKHWKFYKRFPMNHPVSLRLAARLGRSRGRLRVLDHLNPPPQPNKQIDLARFARADFAAAWLGHATTLLRINGRTILTDPALSPRVGLGLGLVTGGPKRLVAPALLPHQLPELDLILVSHAHFDHLDRPTLRRLPKHVPVITSEHNGDLIADLGFASVTELRWGESTTTATGLTVTARRVAHWGARTVIDRHRGYAGFLIETAGRRVLYGGDTAYHNHFTDIGRVDMAVLGIGAYDPWIESHANPEQAWAMANHVLADHVVPVHHSTFRLSSERMSEPIERILTAAGNETDRVVVREIGDLWVA